MITFAPDTTIKIDYNIVKQKDIFILNQVGVHEPYEFEREDDGITNDNNCIYVDYTNGNDNNSGNSTNPVKTLSKAVTLINDEKIYIKILDEYHYNEELQYNDALLNLVDIYKNTVNNPKLSNIQYDVEIYNDNCIFVSGNGDDANGDGTITNPYKTINKANQQITATKNYIIINDSEQYEEKYIICNSNLKGIYANKGCIPTVTMQQYFTSENYEATKDFEKNLYSASTYDEPPKGLLKLKSGYFLIFWYYSGNPHGIYWKVLDKNGTDLYGTKSVTNTNFLQRLYATVTDNYVYITAWSGSTTSNFYVLQLNHLGNYLRMFTYTSSAYGNQKIGRIKDYIYITKRDTTSKFLVIDENGNLINNWTSFNYVFSDEDYSQTYDLRTSDNGTIHISRIDTSTIGIDKINNNYTVTAIGTITGINSGSYGAVIKDNKLIVIYSKNDGKLYCREYDTITGSLLKNETAFVLSGVAVNTLYSGTDLDYYGNIIYSTSGQISNSRTNAGETYIINKEYELITKFTYSAHMGGCYGVFNKVNSIFMSLGYNYYGSPKTLNISALKDFQFNFIMNTNAQLSLKGIKFNSNNLQGYNNFIKYIPSVDGLLSIDHCDFWNIQQVEENNVISAKAIYTTAKNILIKNNKFINNDICIKILTTDGNIEIKNNIFAYNGVEKGVYAIESDALNTEQVYNHNDFLYNYGTIKLLNNNDDVQIKNSIFYMNTNGVDAQNTGIVVENSIYSDTITNASLDATVLNSNPLYINLGIQDKQTIDLNLKTKMTGYSLDTPAYKLADDNTNAGSIICIYIGEKYEYTTITLPKPFAIDISYKSINPTLNIKTNYVTREGLYYEIYLKWETLLNEDVEKIINMYKSESSKIKVYYNPITKPEEFDMYTLVYDTDISLGSIYSLMQDIGRSNIVIHIIRKD